MSFMFFRLSSIPIPSSQGFCAWLADPGRRAALARYGRIGLGLLAACLLSAGALLGLILQSEPLIAPRPESAQHYLARTRTLIRDSVQAVPGAAGRKRLALTAEDLAAVANFAFLRKRLAGRAECAIQDRSLKLAASIKLPFKAFKLFLNLQLVLDDAEPHARIQRLVLGRLDLSAPVVGWLTRTVLRYTPLDRYRRAAERLIEDIRVREDGRLALTVNWSRDSLAQAEGLITDLADKERLLAYQSRLAEVVGQSGSKRFIRLGLLTQPLFTLAKARSESADGDPVAENRALLIVLGAYVNGKSLAAALPAAPPSADPARRDVLLNRRVDTAQHFAVSASLAMAGHNAFVDMVGLAKEMNDTHNGTGFSFADLAADRAGALFGMTAVRSEQKARKLQDLLSRGSDEALFMPSLKDLPENLGPAAFAERYGDIESLEFQALKTQIEARLLACPAYQ
jgi:hypothetical protein